MLDAVEYSSSSSADCLMSIGNCSNSISRRKKVKNKRRFSDEQIKSLETIFDTETKLEPKKKLELARELGLQPRQVAIWFQNKRARWKSKQLERDYSLLQSDYDNLAQQFESLKRERQTLLHQLQKLKDLIENSDGKEAGDDGAGGLVNDEDDPNGAAKMMKLVREKSAGDDEFEVKKTIISEFMDMEIRRECGGLLNVVLWDGDDESSRNPDSYLGLEEETEVPLNTIVEPAVAAQSCILKEAEEEEEEWGSLESNGLLEKASKWWDFWS